MALGSIGSRATGIVGIAVAGIVVLTVLGAVFGDMVTAVADINNDLSTSSFNDTTSDTIAGVMPIIVGVGFVLGVVGLITAAFKFKKV